MDILGIGPLEIAFILLLALIIFGPDDLVKTGKSIGKFLRKIVTSPTWQTVQRTSQELRHLPNKLIREAGIEELQGEIQRISPISPKKILEAEFKNINTDLSAWTTDPSSNVPPSEQQTTQDPIEQTPPKFLTKNQEEQT